jgi:5-methyltetrahydrofolate--homocysteine methyltransferase
MSVRKEFWGYVKEEHLSNEALIKEEYSGIRPAPGYPACPDHTEKYKLFSLLNASENAGIQLTEPLLCIPQLSVRLVFQSPAESIFWNWKIQEDQLKDYAARKTCRLMRLHAG